MTTNFLLGAPRAATQGFVRWSLSRRRSILWFALFYGVSSHCAWALGVSIKDDLRINKTHLYSLDDTVRLRAEGSKTWLQTRSYCAWMYQQHGESSWTDLKRGSNSDWMNYMTHDWTLEYLEPGKTYVVRAACETVGGAFAEERRTIEVGPLAGSVDQGDSVMAYTSQTSYVSGTLKNGARHLSAYRVDQSRRWEVGKFNANSNTFAGELNLRDMKQGETWSVAFYAQRPYNGGTHEALVKTINISKQKEPEQSNAPTRVALKTRLPHASNQLTHTVTATASSAHNIYLQRTRWKKDPAISGNEPWHDVSEGQLPTPTKELELERTFTFARTEGLHWVELCAATRMGTYGCATGHVLLDFTAPELVSVITRERESRGDTIPVEVQTRDTLAAVRGVQVAWRDPAADRSWQTAAMTASISNYGTYTYDLPSGGLGAGQLEMRFKLADHANNETDWLGTRTISVDRTAPDLVWNTPAVDSFGRGVVSGSVSDTGSGPGEDGQGKNAVQVSYREQGKPLASAKTMSCDASAGQFDCDLNLDDTWEGKAITLELSAVDRAGNRTAARQRTFTFDTRAPSVTWVGPNEGRTFPDAFAVAGQLHDTNPKHGLVQWRVPGTLDWQTSGPLEVDAQGQFRFSIPGILSGQAREVRLGGIDHAGHRARESPMRTFRSAYAAHAALDVGLHLPDAQASGLLPGAWFMYQVALSAPAGDINDAQLEFILPAGLQAQAGVAPSLATRSAPVALNRQWRGTDEPNRAQLLGAGARLRKGERIAINVPVRLRGDVVPSRLISSVSAAAGNVSGTQVVRHSVETANQPQAQGKLTLDKTVDKAQAKPGDTLTYTVRFTNLSAETLSNLSIQDQVPPYTQFVDARCGSELTAGLSCVAVPPDNQSATDPRAVRWQIKGPLQQAVSGTVAYRVRINR